MSKNADNDTTRRFTELAKKIVSVPKSEIDKRLAEERRQRKERSAKTEAEKSRA